jgi:hypothetical protein
LEPQLQAFCRKTWNGRDFLERQRGRKRERVRKIKRDRQKVRVRKIKKERARKRDRQRKRE